MRFGFKFGVALILLLAPVQVLLGATLHAGVAKVEITPPAGLPMYGYFDRIKEDEPSTGTLDPLYARVLVLDANGECLAVVTLDLGRTFGPASLRHLREMAVKRSGISHLLVTASHTHSGPNILDEYPQNQTPAWETTALERIAAGIEEARQSEVEVRLGTGYGVAYIGYNRRRVNPDGSVTMLWSNPAKVPTAPVDPTVSVLRVDTADGVPLAILVNYACHPVVFGSDNRKYSADYVGVMCKTVEQAFDVQPLAFFLQGGDGDINPYYAATPPSQDALGKRDWTGEALGREAARIAKSIQTQADSEASLQFAEDVLRFHVRWNPQQFRNGLLAAFGASIFDDHAGFFKQQTRETLDLTVTTALIDRRIAIVGMPGEPFVHFQIDWRARCPVRDALFLGYTNGYFDYFPTIQAATQGGYGADDSNTYVEVGAGERMLKNALVRIYEMLGRLSDTPEDLRKKWPFSDP